MISAQLPTLPYRRILMTGGTGFVGRYLAPRLDVAAPHAERAVVLRSPQDTPPAGWQAIYGDIVDPVRTIEIIADFQPDLVIHMAAQASVGESHSASENTWAVNFGGSFALAKGIALHAPQAVMLFTSSAEVYGASLGEGPVDEQAPLRPQNCYARSKAATEFMLSDVFPKTGRLVIARPFNHLGAGQDERFVMASLAAQIVRIEAGIQAPIVRVGNMDAARDFLDVKDVCDAYIHLLAQAPAMQKHEVFNISTGQARKVQELFALLIAASKARFAVEVDPARLRPNDIPVALGLNLKIVELTGWQPRRPLSDTVRELLEGAREKLKFEQQEVGKLSSSN